jgi:hypothetical protein
MTGQWEGKHETHLRISNGRGRKLALILEPWGDSYPFEEDDEFVVSFYSPQPGEAEIVFGADSVTVYAWAGCKRQVSQNSGVIDSDIEHQPAVPGTPPGLSMRRLLNAVLGRSERHK